MDRGGSGPANGATVHTADTSALELLSDVKQQTLSNKRSLLRFYCPFQYRTRHRLGVIPWDLDALGSQG